MIVQLILYYKLSEMQIFKHHSWQVWMSKSLQDPL